MLSEQAHRARPEGPQAHRARNEVTWHGDGAPCHVTDLGAGHLPECSVMWRPPGLYTGPCRPFWQKGHQALFER